MSKFAFHYHYTTYYPTRPPLRWQKSCTGLNTNQPASTMTMQSRRHRRSDTRVSPILGACYKFLLLKYLRKGTGRIPRLISICQGCCCPSEDKKRSFARPNWIVSCKQNLNRSFLSNRKGILLAEPVYFNVCFPVHQLNAQTPRGITC